MFARSPHVSQRRAKLDKENVKTFTPHSSGKMGTPLRGMDTPVGTPSRTPLATVFRNGSGLRAQGSQGQGQQSIKRASLKPALPRIEALRTEGGSGRGETPCTPTCRPIERTNPTRSVRAKTPAKSRTAPSAVLVPKDEDIALYVDAILSVQLQLVRKEHEESLASTNDDQLLECSPKSPLSIDDSPCEERLLADLSDADQNDSQLESSPSLSPESESIGRLHREENLSLSDDQLLECSPQPPLSTDDTGSSWEESCLAEVSGADQQSITHDESPLDPEESSTKPSLGIETSARSRVSRSATPCRLLQDSFASLTIDDSSLGASPGFMLLPPRREATATAHCEEEEIPVVRHVSDSSDSSYEDEFLKFIHCEYTSRKHPRCVSPVMQDAAVGTPLRMTNVSSGTSPLHVRDTQTCMSPSVAFDAGTCVTPVKISNTETFMTPLRVLDTSTETIEVCTMDMGTTSDLVELKDANVGSPLKLSSTAVGMTPIKVGHAETNTLAVTVADSGTDMGIVHTDSSTDAIHVEVCNAAVGTPCKQSTVGIATSPLPAHDMASCTTPVALHSAAVGTTPVKFQETGTDMPTIDLMDTGVGMSPLPAKLEAGVGTTPADLRDTGVGMSPPPAKLEAGVGTTPADLMDTGVGMSPLPAKLEAGVGTTPADLMDTGVGMSPPPAKLEAGVGTMPADLMDTSVGMSPPPAKLEAGVGTTPTVMMHREMGGTPVSTVDTSCGTTPQQMIDSNTAMTPVLFSSTQTLTSPPVVPNLRFSCSPASLDPGQLVSRVQTAAVSNQLLRAEVKMLRCQQTAAEDRLVSAQRLAQDREKEAEVEEETRGQMQRMARATAEKEIESLMGQIGEQMTQIGQLEATLAERNGALVDLEADKERLKADYKQQITDLQDDLCSSYRQHQQQIADLEAKYMKEDYERLYIRSQNRVRELETQLDAFTQLHGTMERAIAVQADFAAVGATFSQVRKVWSMVKKKDQSLQTMRAQFEEQKQFLEEERSALEESAKEVENELHITSMELARSKASLSHTELLWRQSEETICNLREQVESLESELDHTKTQAQWMLLNQGSEITNASAALAGLSQQIAAALANVSQPLDEKVAKGFITEKRGHSKHHGSKPCKSSAPAARQAGSLVAFVLRAVEHLETPGKASSSDDGNASITQAEEKLQGECKPMTIGQSGSSAFQVVMPTPAKASKRKDGGADSSENDGGEIAEGLPDQILRLKAMFGKINSAFLEKEELMKEDIAVLQQEIEERDISNKRALLWLQEQVGQMKGELDASMAHRHQLHQELAGAQGTSCDLRQALDYAQQRMEGMAANLARFSDQKLLIQDLEGKVQELTASLELAGREKQLVLNQLEVVTSKQQHLAADGETMGTLLKDNLVLKKDMDKVRMKLLKRQEDYELFQSKAGKQMKVLEGNWKKAEAEIHRLDQLFEHCRKVMEKVPPPICKMDPNLRLLYEMFISQ